jgi:hypothetical protein
LSPGLPGEAGQRLHFVIQANTNSSLFVAGPEVDAAGNLTFTPAPNVRGTADIKIALADDGGTAQGGKDTSEAITFTITITKPHPRHNVLHPLDVTNSAFTGVDAQVTPGDALAIINYINANPGQGSIAADAAIGPPYYDTVNSTGDYVGDNFVAPGDALAVINWINTHGSGTPGPSGEGELGPAGEGEAGPAADSDAIARPSAIDLIALLAMDLSGQSRRRRS